GGPDPRSASSGDGDRPPGGARRGRPAASRNGCRDGRAGPAPTRDHGCVLSGPAFSFQRAFGPHPATRRPQSDSTEGGSRRPALSPDGRPAQRTLIRSCLSAETPPRPSLTCKLTRYSPDEV